MELQRISIFSNTKSDRDFRATTGLSKEEFNRLSEKFSYYYTPTVLSRFTNGWILQQLYISEPTRGFVFLLYHYKVATTYDVLAISFGIGIDKLPC